MEQMDLGKLLAKILEKIKKIKLIEAHNVNDDVVQDLIDIDCLIIDNFNNNIDESYFTQF